MTRDEFKALLGPIQRRDTDTETLWLWRVGNADLGTRQLPLTTDELRQQRVVAKWVTELFNLFPETLPNKEWESLVADRMEKPQK